MSPLHPQAPDLVLEPGEQTPVADLLRGIESRNADPELRRWLDRLDRKLAEIVESRSVRGYDLTGAFPRWDDRYEEWESQWLV